MEFDEFSIKLREKMLEINIKITEEQIKQFYIYMKLLLEWNERVNLTAITDPNDIILKHFVDCATILKYIKGTVLDMGSGAGFPGIPLKILNQNIEVKLVDSLNKRVNFLKIVIDELNLSNIEAIHSRAEELGKNKNYREKFDIVVSRAVAHTNILAEYTIPFCKVGGKCIFMKGSNIKEEIETSKRAITILGGEIERIEELFLEEKNNNRNIVVIKKLNDTPIKYPRKPGTPVKEPIQ